MDKEETLNHWKLIIQTVFQAEHNLQDELKPRLENKSITPDEYVTTIAKEIIENGSKRNSK